MADEFRSYDKAPILSQLNLTGCKFGFRELILIAIAGFLLVLVLIFAGLYGNAEKKLAHSSSSAEAIVANTYCTDGSCMKTAARVLDLMNRSVDPCENFYEYACGNYKVVKPLLMDAGSRSVLNDMYTENEDRLINVLEKPISQMHDYTYERKLKEFFQSCNNLYLRERSKGTPFLEKVIPLLGGWKLLGTWEENWDFNTALKNIHVDLWVDALYAPRVGVDEYDASKRVIEISPGGTGKFMQWTWYLNPYMEQMREDYKTFIRRVGSLLLRDADGGSLKNATLQNEYLEEFVNDTFTIEKHIATVATNSLYSDSPYDEINKISIVDLTILTGNFVNWYYQLSNLFNQALIIPESRIVVHSRSYLRDIMIMLASLPESDRNRMLHNYLIWRAAEIYVQELSWEYIHANREIYVAIYNRKNFAGLYRYCYRRAKYHFSDALSALYVQEHFADESKQTVSDITDNLKLALQTQLDKTPWLDQETKKYAKEKLDHVTFKMGYPDWMQNPSTVDRIYNGLTVNVSDYFGNLLSTNKFEQATWNEDLNKGENREEWIYPVYSTVVAVYWYWNEIIAPAGILQSPIFHKNQPHHSTFGSLGSILGRFLHHMVDEWGKFYDKNGYYTAPKSWWSNSSQEAYTAIRECVYDVYVNITRDYVFPSGDIRPVRINAKYYTPIAISWTSGIRLAQIGYSDWLKSQGLLEKMLPGIGLTNEQMLYVAHAQTFCFARDARHAFIRGGRGRVEEDIQINMALGQLQEFSDAFRCKAESKMNHPKKCDYY